MKKTVPPFPALRAVWSINEGATCTFAPTIVGVPEPNLTISANRKRTVQSYGPKFVENIVQAISRDLLADAMMRLAEASALQRGECLPCHSRPLLEAEGAAVMGNGDRKSEYCIVGHVHDEVIIEADQNTPVQGICIKMQQTSDWLPGICLRADGYECPGHYMKS